MPTIPDLRVEDTLAVRISMVLAEKVRPEDLDRPTPCADWDVAALLVHMSAQHRGFAAAAAGRGSSMPEWRTRPVAGDPVADYALACNEVIAAFAPDDVPERLFALPEFGPDVRVPGRQAISFHLIDYVVHAWDIARSIGAPFTVPAGLLRTAQSIAEAVPDGDFRLAPGAAFAPRLPTPSDADPLARIVTLLGRSPSWPDSGR